MVDPRFKMQGGVKRGVLTAALVGTMAFGSVGTAFAADVPFGSNPNGNASTPSTMLRTYGVRAGSAGGDFVGVSNTNFDFTAGSASSNAQYTGYTSATAKQLAGLSIWGTSVNDSANPYYANLLYHAITGNKATGNEATTWMSNPGTSSWGDSNGSASTRVSDNSATIAGLEYSPQIIFGANKLINWNLNSNGSNSGTNIAASGYSATYVNNDATNIWTQIYTMGRLAQAADGLSGTVRYNGNSATQSAIDYEKATKGQMLYVASKIDTGVATKKTVAYLYAIDSNSVGHFFTPKAEGLLTGNDTGKTSSSAVTTADGNYAANNSTINMGYMATLPFITTTFDSGHAESIVMKVEDIYKSNPACTVGASDSLANVDVIIINTTVNTDLQGTSGGKNESSVNNAAALTPATVQTWAASHGFTGTIIGGDDFGTSTNQQGVSTSQQTSSIETAPVLYCQRNYTADKNARAAWAFAKVYPELYNYNSNATYAYWVDKVYHVKQNQVGTVAAYMTNQSSVAYSSSLASTIDSNAEAGYTWWKNTGSSDAEWSGFAYYNGSSRASYYSGNESDEEPANTIGIFAPSELWKAANGDLNADQLSDDQ